MIVDDPVPAISLTPVLPAPARKLPRIIVAPVARPLDCAPDGEVCEHVERAPAHLTRNQALLRGVALLVAAAALLPVLYLVLRAAGAGTAALEYLLSARTLAVVGNSLLLTAAVAAAAVLIGVPFAWLTARTDLPLRRFWLVAGLLTLVIPSYIGAMTFLSAFGPRGYVQQMLAPLGVGKFPPLYGFFGAWLTITLFTYPYVVMPVRAALLNMDPSWEEAARGMGLSRREVFWRVTLPQLRPALAAGVILAALYTLSDFGAVALMQYDAFTRVIFTQYTSAFDRSLAASLSLVLVAVTGSLLILERRVARGRGANGSRGAGHHHAHAHYRLGAGAARGLQPVRLGRWRGPALAFCAALVGLGVVVPVAVLLTWLTSAQRVAPTGTDLLGPALNTFWAGLLTALVVGAAGLPLAILGARGVGRFGRGLAQAAYLGNGLPGLVIALALVFFGANLVPALYQTLPLLIFGYAIRFLPLSVGATRSALAQINPRFEEAGCSLGLSPWWVAWRVTVPLARAGVLGGMALAFLSAAKELPATLLLAPTGFRTLTTEIWMAQAQARYTQAAAPALLIILLSALSLALILRGNHKAGKRA